MRANPNLLPPAEWQRRVQLAARVHEEWTNIHIHGKPDVPEHVAVGRFMATRKRAWRSPAPRTFPRFYPGMTTAQYVRLYYADNGLGGRPMDTMGYPDSYIRPINRPAPELTEDQPELLAEAA